MSAPITEADKFAEIRAALEAERRATMAYTRALHRPVMDWTLVNRPEEDMIAARKVLDALLDGGR